MLGSSGQWAGHKLESKTCFMPDFKTWSTKAACGKVSTWNHTLGRAAPVHNLGLHPLPAPPVYPLPPPGVLCSALVLRRPCLHSLSEHSFGPITTDVWEGQTFYHAENYLQYQQYLSKILDGYCGLGGTRARGKLSLRPASPSCTHVPEGCKCFRGNEVHCWPSCFQSTRRGTFVLHLRQLCLAEGS